MTTNTSKKPVILHVINSLDLGGAELLLKNSIQLLPEYRHVIVYLLPSNDHEMMVFPQNVELICLQHAGWESILGTILKLKSVIRSRKPLLVHSHLFDSTICARLAAPVSVPLVSTIHSQYSKDAFDKSNKSIIAARLTLKKRHALIGVSDFILNDYLSYIPFKGKRFVLHNFLPDEAFQKRILYPTKGKVKFVAVGNLKEAKNYFYLLEIFKYLNGASLDIYGEGSIENELREHINKENLDVRLCGSTNNIPGIFQEYDFFIQASSHEGFGLSVIEAMAAGLPVLLSDIPVFREITSGLANFFPLNNAKQAAEVLGDILKKQYPAERIDKAFEFVKETYSAQNYRQKLLAIYSEITSNALSRMAS